MTIQTLLNVWNNVWPYLIAVLMFLLLIIIHEFGHFIAAKLCGVRVNEFAVGFGPCIFSKQGKETKYSINLIPFGGYCAMEGEDEGSTDPRAFCNKGPLKRFIIVIMGAVFNILLGIVLVAVSLAGVKTFSTLKIAKFSENAVSNTTGLNVNDEFISVDGRRVYTTRDLSYAFMGVDDGKIDVVVRRDGQKVALKDVTFATETYEDVNCISVDFYVYGEESGFLPFLKYTFKTTVSYVKIIWYSLIDLICGKFGLNTVSGPIGITASVGDVAKSNILDVIPIMALISINLGIFNLFPIPALDGGRLLFIVAEMIAGKPVAKKYEAFIHAVGFAILFLLMVLIAAKDIFSLIRG